MELMQNVGAAANNHLARAKVSVFVISFNRKALISACLAPLSFADELIVIDKGASCINPKTPDFLPAHRGIRRGGCKIGR